MPEFKFLQRDAERLYRLLKELSPIALEVNQTTDETANDFITLRRDGQCCGAVEYKGTRFSVSFVPDKKQENNCHSVDANNEINCLLEHPEAQSTFPYLEERKELSGGGVRILLHGLFAVRGFHPKINEACSILACIYLSDTSLNEAKIEQIKGFSERFKNKFAYPIACKVGLIEGVSYEEAVKWVEGNKVITVIKKEKEPFSLD